MKYINLYEKFSNNSEYSIKILTRSEYIKFGGGVLTKNSTTEWDSTELSIIKLTSIVNKSIDRVTNSRCSATFYTNMGYNTLTLVKHDDEYYSLGGFHRDGNHLKNNEYAILIDGKDSFLKLNSIIKDNIILRTV